MGHSKELYQMQVIMDRVEARIGGRSAMPFINPCPSAEEWLAIRELLEKEQNAERN